MADILTLAQARAALNWKDGTNLDRDDELVDLYIPAVTQTIEAICGRLADRWETWTTSASSPITTPWPDGSVTAVVSGSRVLTGWSFSSGVLTVTDPLYTAGASLVITAGSLPTPAPVILAAQIILAHNWNADKQGRGQGVRGENEAIPLGFTIPRRAEALLAPYSLVTVFA